MMQQLYQAYIVAIDRANRSQMTIYIIWAVDVYSNGGYIVSSQISLPQLSELYEEFEIIDVIKPGTELDVLH